MKSWKEKSFSRGGKKVFIKSVAQAIPSYVMSCFMMPKGLCEDIEQVMCKFWWGDGTERRKIHWMKWSKMCVAKDRGGMGFRDMECFNVAMLARQGWRLLQHPDSLLARMLKARYYPRIGFMEAGTGYRPSYAWQSVLRGREALDKGLRWSVGNGDIIHVWEDK